MTALAPSSAALEIAIVMPRSLNDPVALVNSVNPVRIQGQKTAAFEIVDVLGDAPDVHFMPVGNAGNITAYWKGYAEYCRPGRANEAATDARLAGGGCGADRARRAGAPPRDDRHRDPDRQPGLLEPGGRERRDESGGHIGEITDAKILEAYRCWSRARRACSSSRVGGVRRRAPGCERAGPRRRGQTVVCTVTGHGLKDPQWPSTERGRLRVTITAAPRPARTWTADGVILPGRTGAGPLLERQPGPRLRRLGLALGLYDDVVVRVAERHVGRGRRRRRRQGGDRRAQPGRRRCCAGGFTALGGQPRGLALRSTNRIPQGRGMGLSASAIVAGARRPGLVVGGNEQLSRPGRSGWPPRWRATRTTWRPACSAATRLQGPTPTAYAR